LGGRGNAQVTAKGAQVTQPKVTCLLKISKVVIKINISIVFPKQHKNHSSIKQKKVL
jgi:hypothetical protein